MGHNNLDPKECILRPIKKFFEVSGIETGNKRIRMV